MSSALSLKHEVSRGMDGVSLRYQQTLPCKKGIFDINTKRGGTNRFGFHLLIHKKADEPACLSPSSDSKCRETISEAAAMAVMLDLRPLSFVEGHAGMASFAESIFKAGQTVPFRVAINRESYLPSRTAINTKLQSLVQKWQENFTDYFKEHLHEVGRAVSVDGVTLKIQGCHFLDFNLLYLAVVKGKTILETPTFRIKKTTVLFVESPEAASGSNLRAHLDDQLRLCYVVDFHSIQNSSLL